MDELIKALKNAPPGFVVSIARMPRGVKVLAVGPEHPQQRFVLEWLRMLQEDLERSIQ